MFKKILLGLVLSTTAMGAARIKNADIASDAAIVDTKLNTISTAGKVSNSATTAASANTASAIVARNASGAFYASTISADLVGNVTGNLTGNATTATSATSATSATTATTATTASQATRLVTDPADCAANNYAISSDAFGNMGCTQVSMASGVTGTLPVSNGGTGNASLTAYRLLLSGTTSTGALQVMSSEGTAGQVLTSGGPNTLPTFTTISAGSSTSAYLLASFGSDCAWADTTSSYPTLQDFPVDSSCTFTNEVSSGFSSVSSADSGSDTNKYPGVDFTPDATGTYRVTVTFAGNLSSAEEAAIYEIYDGSSSLIKQAWSTSSSSTQNRQQTLSYIFSGTASVAKSLRLRATRTTGTLNLRDASGVSKHQYWLIEKI